MDSTVSNFGSRTKVISFNDKKCSLGSVGAATIVKLKNQFNVRHFPDGPQVGFRKAVEMMDSKDWEKEVEGLEMFVSLGNQHPEVT